MTRMTKEQQQAEVLAMACDHLPWAGTMDDPDNEGQTISSPDIRTIGDLEEEFLNRHFYGGLLNSYRDNKSKEGRTLITRQDVHGAVPVVSVVDTEEEGGDEE